MKEKLFLDKMVELDEDFREGIEQNILLEKAFTKINELVEHRNDISHGVDDADENILSINVILEYCSYFKVLIESIYIIVMRQFASLMINNEIN